MLSQPPPASAPAAQALHQPGEQEQSEYNQKNNDKNGQGNVSLWEEQLLVQAHISFARTDGQTLSGHLTKGTVLFAGELVLREFLGPDRLRRKDAVTGAHL